MSILQCGICYYKPEDGSGMGRETFYCAACIQFKLLKYNLNKLHIQKITSMAVNDINKVLNVCLGDKSRVFLKKYINGEYIEEKLIGTNVNIDSVARLAFMLMNVEMITKQNHLKEIDELITLKRKQTKNIEDRILMLKQIKEMKQKRVQKLKIDIEYMKNNNDNNNNNNNNNILKNKNKVKIKNILYDNEMIMRQEQILDNQRRLIIFDIIVLWNIEIHSVKKISILFAPIVSIDEITKYNLDFVFETFLKSCEFVDILSKVIGIEIPFEIGTEYNELRIGDKIFKFNGKNGISELSKFGILELCVGISRIILNVVILLREIDESFKHEAVSIANLLAYNELLVRVVKAVKKRIDYDHLMADKLTKLAVKREKEQQKQKKLTKKKIKTLKQGWLNNLFQNRKVDVNEERTSYQHTETSVKRYMTDYDALLRGNLLPDMKSNISVTPKSTLSAVPNSALDGNPAIKDSRLLAEEVYKVLYLTT
jgi:hypothetical protein